jgi:hypothetical protein
MNEVELFPSPVEGARDGNSTPYLRWRNVNDYFTSGVNFGIWLRYYLTAGEHSHDPALRSCKAIEDGCPCDWSSPITDRIMR